MANIAIINYCNLHCPYCFANEYIEEEQKQLITKEQLEDILFFLSHTANLGKIGVIGGEPTLHPDFADIIKRMKEFGKEHEGYVSVFSNGIKLGEYAKVFTENSGVLLNLNHPDIVGKEYEDIIRGLKRFKVCGTIDKVTLGINLYPGMLDYNYIFDALKQFNMDHVRCSYVAPTCLFTGVDKEKYYTEAKPLFVKFCKDAKAQDIKVGIDCNHVPVCYFSDEELAEINNVDGWHSLCNPVVDITPDMKGSACFGAYDLIDLKDFESITDVENYLLFKKTYPRRLNNSSGKCATCKKFENLSCQGGCLAFSA